MKWKDENGKFRELSKDEIAELTDKEVIDYYNDLTNNKLENVKIENENQLKELNEKIEKLQKSKDIDEIKANIDGLNETIRQFATNSQKPNDLKVKTLDELLLEQKEVLDNPENYRQNKVVKLDLSNVVEKATTTTGSIVDNNIVRRINGLGDMPTPTPTFDQNVNTITVVGEGNIYAYTDYDEATAVRAAQALAEGDTYPEGTIGWKGYTIKLEKIGSTMKVTDEMMRYYPTFVQQVRQFLTDDVNMELQTALYSGNGTSPNITGLYNQAPDFNYAGYSGPTTPRANLIDLINVITSEITKGKGRAYNVDIAFVSFSDYLKLQLEKDANGIPIMALIEKNTSVKIVRSAYVTDNTLLMGDSRRAVILRGSTVELQLGYINDDFGKDLYTLKGRVYANALIRHIDRPAWRRVTNVEQAIDAITTP